MLTIDAATDADRADLAARMTAADRAELVAAGVDPQCLDGVQAQALRWHGRLVCLFGVEPMPSNPAAGVPWMLCTDTLAEVPRRAMAGVSAQVVAIWRGEFSRLINLVHRKHSSAVRFVRWLGFRVDESPVGPGAEFFTFSWERPNV